MAATARSVHKTHEVTAKVAGMKKNMEALLLAVARQAIQELCYRVVRDTPVVLGILRGSWQPSIGVPENAKNPAPDPGGSRVMTDAIAKLQGLKLGDTFYMTNNCVYARRVEYGFVGPDKLGRVYNQQGRFFMTKNLKSWSVIVKRTLKTLKALS